MQSYLPNQGRMSFPEMASLIRQSPRLYAVPTVLAIKSLLAESAAGELEHYGTVLRVGKGDPASADETKVTNHHIGYVRLLEHMRRPDTVVDEERLKALLTFWERQPEDVFFGGFIGETLQVQWYASRNSWGEAPCWAAYISGHHRVGIGPPEFRRGPVLDERLPFFAPTLEAAAAKWLGREVPAGPNRYWIIIPDLRARLSAIEVNGSEVRVQVERQVGGRLLCASQAQSYDGDELADIKTLDENEARLDLGRTPRTLQVFLFDIERRLLDRFDENEAGSSWGTSVLFPGRVGGPAVASLEQARESGEGEQVEFKPLVLGGRGNQGEDAKIQEVIETVVAFANGEGGAIYLGVDDHGNLVGTLGHVFRRVGSTAHGQADKARDLFVGELRSLIGGAVAPSITLSMEWITQAEHLVLRIVVPPGADRLYHTVDQNRFFIRRGATNRPMTREELVRALQR